MTSVDNELLTTINVFDKRQFPKRKRQLLAVISTKILLTAFVVGKFELHIHKTREDPWAIFRAVARTLIGRCIFIYLGSARLTSFEINFISKETSRAEPEYMNIHPPPLPN